MAISDFDQMVEQYHREINTFSTGKAGPLLALLSRGSDVSIAGGFGGFVQGYDRVAEAISYAATQFREGNVSFKPLAKVVTRDMAYIVEVEGYRSKLGGSTDVSLDVLRVTTIFRREDGAWKMVHRHGDPTTAMNALTQLVPNAVVSIRKAV